MKTILLGLLLSTAAAHADLSGQYILHTADCIVGGIPGDPVTPLSVKVVASDERFTMTIPVNFQGQVGDMPYADYSVGDQSGIMLGGSTFRETALYSNGGNTMSYHEFDNLAAGLPLRELRGTIYQLDGVVLTITQTGDGLSDRKCIATRM